MINTNYELTFNSFVFIRSLEDSESYTTTTLKEFVNGHESNQLEPLNLQLGDIKSADNFRRYVGNLTINAKNNGLRPFLNIDCHGNKDEGLVFLDESTMVWDEVADCLRPLNEATEFNLMVVFSCCFGAHFLGGMGVIKPAPCAFILGPTDTIDGSEILNGLLSFYGMLLGGMSLVQAVLQARKSGLVSGSWSAEFAASWYLEVVKSYIEHRCKKDISRQRVNYIFQKYKAENANQRHGTGSMSEIKRRLAKSNRENLTKSYFNTYFMLDKLPKNSRQYENLRKCTQDLIDGCKKTGKYLL